ncbi:hypothetical protein LCGC14_1150040 [marine sediment metagenome]|uniref:Uncharacterized protein n=1 Tax=marine sediment metagenome TaxID=412755 RepID=A0A0F9MIY9_9ZZZZ
MTHTPTPWSLDVWVAGDFIGIDGNEKRRRVAMIKQVPRLDTADRANAEFIIRAANSHEALLEALEARYASLSEPNGLHKYIKGTHASLCVACTWREWTQSLIRLAKGEKGANSG